MRGFTFVELTISMILLFIVTGICVLLLSQNMRNSEIVLNRINAYDELARISSALRRELLKAGPTAAGIDVQNNSLTFTAFVPFSQSQYGTYGSSTRLIYSVIFSNGRLYVQIRNFDSSYTKTVELGQLTDCQFSSLDNRIIRYTLVKRTANRDYKITSSVVLSNVR
ncbi:PulJ/GspJ family protein [Pseudothermotoga sp. U03pept]|uniref:PulJ/GspJ family protein n=1 Tax=Pseudothermotoga sp. U03pept TaxID=3447012 RepID=UPI003F0D4162